MKQLPKTYYLDHFYELRDYLMNTCAHLLDARERSYLARFSELSESAQLMCVRILNRRSQFILLSALNYVEIKEPIRAMTELKRHGFVQDIAKEQLHEWLSQCTKVQLQELLAKQLSIPKSAWPPKSAVKERWLTIAQQIPTLSLQTSPLYQSYIQQSDADLFSYFSFLYFGRLTSRLDAFSMRDMGLMSTQRQRTTQQARFDERTAARAAFVYAGLLQQLKAFGPEQALKTNIKDLPEANGDTALRYQQRYLFELGKLQLLIDVDAGLTTLKQSSHPKAQEKYLRELYKKGFKTEVKAFLEAILDDPSDESLAFFAEDFYTRKFKQKRTSVLTDMLRNAEPPVALDEAFLGQPERGVQLHFKRQGELAYQVENQLWQGFFGLIFWRELFQSDAAGVANEFDRLPQALRNNSFYRDSHAQIEQRLAQFVSIEHLWLHLRAMSIRFYGHSNGLFRWHSKLLERLRVLIENSSLDALKAILRLMSQNYKGLSDGFPDLMVLGSDGLRFEEVKAAGDVLRRNQWITISHLKKLGWSVFIRPVEWRVNPEQPYVVVDIETTGGRAGLHRITEVAMVRMVGDKVVERWQSLINPQRHIPKAITELTGIDHQMVANAPIFGEVATEIRTFMQDAIFVAHNVEFDYRFLQKEFANIGQYFVMPKLCTVKLARTYLPGYRSYGLAALCETLDIPLQGHHRAMNDATAAAAILRQINQQRLAAKNDTKEGSV